MVISLCFALLAAACTDSGSDDDETGSVGVGRVADATRPSRLALQLSEGSASQVADPATSVVTGTALTDNEVTAILDRLPVWDVPDTDQVESNRPTDSLRPPLIGDTVEGTFPPTGDADPTADEAADGPLEVLRVQPEGAVPLAAFLSITFNQPMVPLATLDQLGAEDVPVTVTPAVEGRWRWIGTRTLRFEVDPGLTDRLPAATEYQVEIPAGTVSANGARLAEAVRFQFATPAPRVESFVGASDSMPLTSVFVAVFDQVVDPESILSTTTLEVGADERPVRVATTDEIEADEEASSAIEDALEGRAVAFVATDPLPVDQPVVITFEAGTASTEGPRVTDSPQTFRGRTFGNLRVSRTDCGYGDGCRPLTPLRIEFSNPLDLNVFTPSMVGAEPAIPGMRVNVYGNTIEVAGATAGRTTYEITLSAAITDTFGQTLGDDVTERFEVGPALPWLRGFDRQFVTVDPTAPSPTVSISTINHESVRVRAWSVSPDQYGDYLRYLESTYADTRPPEPSWPVVLDQDVAIDAPDDTFAETAIDLTDAFDQSDGPIVVRIEPTRTFSPDSNEYWQNQPSYAFVQQTTVAIDAIVDNDELLIWTTDLRTGEPLGDVDVEVLGRNESVTTDQDGLARLSLNATGVTGLVATVDDRIGMLPSSWYDGWQAQQNGEETRWYVFDDRGIYKPGETARVTGWIRTIDAGKGGPPELVADSVTVDYQVYDPQYNEIASGQTEVNALGGFNLAVDIPAAANLGQATIEFQLSGPGAPASGYGNHWFQIQEFRTPEFEVLARAESAGPYLVAEPATIAVDANYYAGGPLPDAEVQWLVSTAPTSYSPPGWDPFVFGQWQPWWIAGPSFEGGYGIDGYRGDFGAEGDICFDCGPGFGSIEYEQFAGRTDGGGHHYLQLDFTGPEIDLPSSITAESTVFDVNRQAFAGRTSLLVHAARQYVGLRTDRPFVEKGTPIRVDVVVTDIDGAAVAGRDVEVTAGRVESIFADGTWTDQVVDSTTCTITSIAAVDASSETPRCEFATDIGGSYRITAIVTDDDGHRNRTEITQWVTGAESRPSRLVQQETVTIVPDRATYAEGDTAELFVQAPFSPASGLVTVMHGGIESTISFDAPDGTAVVDVPIEAGFVPNVSVQVDMVGSAVRTADDATPLPDAPRRPAFATGRIDLAVPPLRQTLQVMATPGDPLLQPGADTSVTVEVRDADGEPVDGAGVAIVVVDEAVLALTGYQLSDPLDTFYGMVYGNAFAEYVRSSVVLSQPETFDSGNTAGGEEQATDDGTVDEEAVEEEASADFALSDGDDTGAASPTTTAFSEARQAGTDAAGSGVPLEVRTDFGALAVYAPDETTTADGTVTVAVALPDNLTRYRVMAVAVDGAERFGKGEANITARLPLMVRPSAPRFLNFGDRFELPIVVQNQTDGVMSVDIVVQSSNLALTDAAEFSGTTNDGAMAGQRVTVPANDRVEVRFPAASDRAGTARFRVAAVSGDDGDAAQIELPVYTPATAEAFATYGVLDGGDGAIAQPLLAPVDVFSQFGGLEINTSSTALQALTDAVLYVTDYEYDSADGHASRIMAVAALRDVLEAFSADGLPSAAALNAQVARDIERLAALQNDDGGFPYWQRGQLSIPWQSIQSTHALVLADQAGYQVPDATLAAALDHLANIESFIPTDYAVEVRTTLSAYALHVRNLAGQRDSTKAEGLYTASVDTLQLDALAWLWPVVESSDIRSAISRTFENRAVETAGAAVFANDYGEDAYVIANSDRRTDGVILDALITQAPDSDLIPKVVAGLLGNQIRGRWNNVQENAFILLALHRYFDTFESVTPEFVARAWLGDRYVAEAEFRGRSTDRSATLVPMAELIDAGNSQVVVANDGVGRLYYRLGLRYAPEDLTLEARDEGFVVERIYEGVDDPADVRRETDGTWYIRAGSTVRVRLTMVADAQRTHVALIDPLPAGFEAQNPGLAVTPTTPPEEIGEGSSWTSWNYGGWFEHQNLRDDRAEAFTSYLPGGTYDYSYIARATTPGTFVVPPTRAEEIYAPEVFGRSPSATVVVEG